ncbi:catalase family protein [Beijerinckia sp. L45]|uniref:catalase family protein n=1 Tax=Beijerinckia sp. L45 TaxID=1641855 RepID=UPI00131E6DFC|nr:catalase family protein [Beijerinckia sp. L45]
MSAQTAMNVLPLRFDSSMETIGKDEAKTNEGLIETLGKISESTFEHSGHATRSVHAKAHGVLRGDFTVVEGLPLHLAQGLFARPGRYEVAMRFSTLPGDILDDSVSTPRGLAIKLVGVQGPRLPGSEADTTQDFVMVNGPAFSAPNAEKFLGVLKVLAATTDKVEGVKKVVSAIAQGTESIIEAFGGKSPTITTMGGQKETNILGETFFSQVPILYGDYVAKYSVAPVGVLKTLTDAPIDTTDNPNALRNAVSEHFAGNGGDWEFRVQLCTDLATMPIEDATVVWPEDKSPYVVVARLHVEQQPSWSPTEVAAIDDGLSFSPWHGLFAHRPLGSVNRARNTTYASSANFRSTHNGCPIHEPKTPRPM